MDKTARREFFSQCVCCESPTAFRGEGLSRRNFLTGSAAIMGLGLRGRRVPGHRSNAGGGSRQAAPDRRPPPHRPAGPGRGVHPPAPRPAKWSVARSLDGHGQGRDHDRDHVDPQSRRLVRRGRTRRPASSRATATNTPPSSSATTPAASALSRPFRCPTPTAACARSNTPWTCSRPRGSRCGPTTAGKYLGDPAFLPVFEELNRRKAVVYTHPTVPNCCVDLVKGVSEGRSNTGTDTTRTIASLVFGEGETATRFPDVHFIWSHSGGTLPFLTSRFEEQTKAKPDPRLPNGPVPIFQTLLLRGGAGQYARPTGRPDEDGADTRR